MKYMKKSFSDMEVYFSKNLKNGVIINSNEAPYNPPKEILDLYFEKLKDIDFNRYPDMANSELCEAIGKAYGVKSEMVSCGVGSDELLEVTFRATLEALDNVVSFSPSFSMYEVFAKLTGANFIPIYFNDDLSFDVDKMIEAIKEYQPKLVLICTPNNPTGQVLKKEEVIRIVNSTEALVLLDLAYVDFAEYDYTDLATKYQNLIVYRTFSKAYALASIRCGYAISNKDNIDMINAVKAPYSLSVQTQLLAKLAIDNRDLYKELIEDVKKERERVYQELVKLGFRVYPSEANFLFVYMDDSINDELLKNEIYIRRFKSNTYRITIGYKEENDRLLEVIRGAK